VHRNKEAHSLCHPSISNGHYPKSRQSFFLHFYFFTLHSSLFKRHRFLDLAASENDVSLSLSGMWLVHEGYLAGLSLVRISLVTKPSFRPVWRRYKCKAKVVYILYSCNQQFVCRIDAIFRHLDQEDLKLNCSVSDSHM
jgi:hypothetical protein